MLSRSYSQENEITQILTGAELNSSSASRIFDTAMQGKLPDSQMRALLVLLANRAETSVELLAAWKAIRKAENTRLQKISGVLDTCGTGGDGSCSINLSTLSSFVMAAAGVHVIKHGNRAITSRCGSSDLLAAFGMNLNQSPQKVIQSAKKTGMGYFHAPSVHPVYSHFQHLRRGIRTRTLFNLLGPVLNPVAVDYQVLGIASEKLLPLYAELLPQMGRKSALIVLGFGGMDEITTLGISRGLTVSGRKTKSWKLNPHNFNFKKGKLKELQIQSIEQAKKKAVEILKLKKTGTALDSVILSAACGIWIAGKASSIRDGVKSAETAVHSGKAWDVLNQMIQFSKL